jgi:hypothetical protein
MDEITATSEELLDILAEHAELERPRLFCVYGLSPCGEPRIGWGMDFGEDTGVLFYSPGSATQWCSPSAGHILARHRQLGRARLHWLDSPYDPTGRHSENASPAPGRG